jgi:hypothetical protein
MKKHVSGKKKVVKKEEKKPSATFDLTSTVNDRAKRVLPHLMVQEGEQETTFPSDEEDGEESEEEDPDADLEF